MSLKLSKEQIKNLAVLAGFYVQDVSVESVDLSVELNYNSETKVLQASKIDGANSGTVSLG